MTIDALPTSDAPTHVVSLEDGSANKVGLVSVDGRAIFNPRAIIRSPLQRTSLKTSQGSTKYSDFSEPFTPVSQDDWSGGRGQEDFERDRSRFFDSYRVNTWMANQVVLGPQEQYTTGYRVDDYVMPGSVLWVPLITESRYVARSFTAQGGAMDRVYLWVKRTGTPGNLVVELNNNNAGVPGTVRQTVTVAPSTFGSDTVSRLYDFDWSGTDTLTGSTTYWIKIYAASADSSTNYWSVGYALSGTPLAAQKTSSDNSSWSSSTAGLYFRLVDTDDDRGTIYFEYKGGWYGVTVPADGSASQVYLNGDRGVADSNSGALNTLVDASKSWTADQYNGCVVLVQAGTGQFEDPPWRVITDTTTTTLVVSPNWKVTQDTTTEYVILGTNEWTEISGHGLTVPVTDVLVGNRDVVYFAQGDATTLRRFRGYNNSGTWTNQWAADGSNTASFFTLAHDPSDKMQIWRADVDKSAVSRDSVPTWGTDLTFGSWIKIGSDDEHITGLERYGSPEIPWILKEGSIWSVDNDIAQQVPLREMMQVKSTKNGKAHLVHGVYLYISLLHSLERFYRNNLDDVGPSRDYGLPANRQGAIVSLQGYPGRFFAAVDGGSSNYSSILTTTGSEDWHEIYRGPEVGQRIRNLAFQVIPGSTVDRLWFSQGMDMMWLPFPSDTTDPTRDANYLFIHEGHLITSWTYLDLQDVAKLFKSVKVFGENYSSTVREIRCDYQTDGDTETDTWTEISGSFNTVPVEEVDFSSGPVASPVTGKRIRLRFRFVTNDASESPRMKASIIEAIGRIATKFQYSINYRAKDEDLDLEGDEVTEFTTVQGVMTQLDSWANSATPLTMRCIYSPFDNKTVLLDPSTLQPYANVPDEQVETHVAQVVATEI